MEVKKSVWAQEKGSRTPRARTHQTFLNTIAQQLSPHYTPVRETQTGENPCSPESGMHPQEQLSLRAATAA